MYIFVISKTIFLLFLRSGKLMLFPKNVVEQGIGIAISVVYVYPC